MKGIILAGGNGTRLYPATLVTSKQLLPIYDKPMIYYPLSVLMLSGIKEILIITTPQSLNQFQQLLRDGSQLGISIKYSTQEHPRGLADAFIVGQEFIGNSSVCMILGDNIFYGHNLIDKIKDAIKANMGASVFCQQVKDPERYGVAQLDETQQLINVTEKPSNPPSNWAVTGLYVFDNSVYEKACKLAPSKRGELEIVDIINKYIKTGNCKATLLGRGIAWLDTGTFESMLAATNFIQTIEQRQGYKIACIEEIAYKLGYITYEQMLKLAANYSNSSYGDYILNSR